MTQTWIRHLIRSAVYLYFAVGASLLLNGALFYLWLGDGRSEQSFPPIFLVILFVMIVATLFFWSRNALGAPISARKWIPLCMLASVGILPIVLLLGSSPT